MIRKTVLKIENTTAKHMEALDMYLYDKMNQTKRFYYINKST